jgi:hypothetical protein
VPGKKLRTVRASEVEIKPPPDSSEAWPASALTWRRIARIEPRLAEAERLIKMIQDPGGDSFCANDIWYGERDYRFSFKKRVNAYTGWFAERPELRSDAAYDMAYEHLYGLLPDCRNCLCG